VTRWLPALALALLLGPLAHADDKKPESDSWFPGLPLLGDQARAAGAELPRSVGVALVMTGLKGRDINVTDLRIGLTNAPRSVSRFVDLGSTSNVVNANLKVDVWLLPFLNVYTLFGYVNNSSATHLQVNVPRLGPIPGVRTAQATVDTKLDGFLGGGGATLAGGYKQLFGVLDCNYEQIDMGFDDTFHALIASSRIGWNGKVNEIPMQYWIGAGYWNTAATAKGHVDLPEGRLVFEADQRPVSYWMYDLGGQISFSRRFQLFIDVGTDFRGGYVFAAGPTWRF